MRVKLACTVSAAVFHAANGACSKRAGGSTMSQNVLAADAGRGRVSCALSATTRRAAAKRSAIDDPAGASSGIYVALDNAAIRAVLVANCRAEGQAAARGGVSAAARKPARWTGFAHQAVGPQARSARAGGRNEAGGEAVGAIRFGKPARQTTPAVHATRCTDDEAGACASSIGTTGRFAAMSASVHACVNGAIGRNDGSLKEGAMIRNATGCSRCAAPIDVAA